MKGAELGLAVLVTFSLSACAAVGPTEPTTEKTVTVTTTPEPSRPPSAASADPTSQTKEPTASQPGSAFDPGQPENSLEVGQTATIGDLEVTLRQFQKVTAIDPLDGWNYYGAEIEVTNIGAEPALVVTGAQARLENVNVATVEPVDQEITEGNSIPADSLRPGVRVKGWVVFAVYPESELLDSFGFFFSDIYGDEAAWWNPLPG